MIKILEKIKAHKILTGFAAAVLIVIVYFIMKSFAGTTAVSYVLTPVERGTIISTVTGSGQVSALNQIDIKPDISNNSSTVVSTKVIQGQDVKAGQVIATLNSSSAFLALTQARATLENAQANYNNLVSGPTALDLKSTQLSLDTAKQNLINVTQQQTMAIETARRNYLNNSNVAIPGRANTGAVPTITGTYTGDKEGQYNITLIGTGIGLMFNVSGLENAFGAVESTAVVPLGTMGLYIQFPSDAAFSDTWTIFLPNQQASNHISTYNTYQTALQTQKTSLQSAQNQIDSAQAALDLKIEPATAQNLANAQAQIDSAKAQLANAQSNYNGTIIIAPFDGKIAAVNVQKGNTVTASTVVATIVTSQKVAVISLNEVDATKISVGQKATLTYDALPGLSIAGAVSQIDTIGAISQGVVSYNVKINQLTQDDRIKPNMSVSVSIILDVKADVLILPNSAIKTQNNQKYVEILDNPIPNAASIAGAVTSSALPTRVFVQVGASNDTDTEIVSGLNEGEKAITKTIIPAAFSTSASTGTSRSGVGIPGIGGGGATRVLGR